jgi:hypothetical protein
VYAQHKVIFKSSEGVVTLPGIHEVLSASRQSVLQGTQFACLTGTKVQILTPAVCAAKSTCIHTTYITTTIAQSR